MQILGCMQKKLFRIVDNFIAQNWHRFIISHSGILQNFQLFKYSTLRILVRKVSIDIRRNMFFISFMGRFYFHLN